MWVIQDNLNNDDKILLPILNKLDIQYTLINIVPFSDNIPDVGYNGPKIVRGSTTTLKGAEKKGWKPGVWHNENFKPSWYKECFGEDYLNKAGGKVSLLDLPSMWNHENHLFVRPDSDYKEFTGGPMTKKEAIKLQRSAKLGQMDFDENFIMFVAPILNVYHEFRFTVVNKKVICGASYRLNKSLRHVDAPDDWMEYAQKLADKCDLDEVYSLDIGETKDGVRGVVECNCFNASGIYGNAEIIVREVTKFVETKHGGNMKTLE